MLKGHWIRTRLNGLASRPRRFARRPDREIRAMVVVHGAELADIIVEVGGSAKSLNRPGMQCLLALVDSGDVQAAIVAKLDRLTRTVKDLCELLERFERRGVALIRLPNRSTRALLRAGWC